MRASSWLLVNESLGLAFARSAHGAILAAVHNRLSRRHVTFSGHDGFLLVVGEAHEPVRQAECQVVSQEIDDAAGTLKERLHHATTGDYALFERHFPFFLGRPRPQGFHY